MGSWNASSARRGSARLPFRCFIGLPRQAFPDGYRSLLLDALAPCARRLRGERALLSWHWTIISWADGEKYVGLFLRPGPAAGAEEALAARLRDEWDRPVRAAGGRLEFRLPAAGPAQDRRERFDFEAASRLYGLFASHASGLIVELLDAARQRRVAASPSTLCLATFYFLMDALAVRPEERATALSAWLDYLSRRRDPSGRTVAAVAREARARFSADPALRGALERFRRQDFMDEELQAAFERYRRPLARVGRMLLRLDGRFSPQRPRLFVIFQTFIHLTYFCLGFPDGFTEESLQRLILIDEETRRSAGAAS